MDDTPPRQARATCIEDRTSFLERKLAQLEERLVAPGATAAQPSASLHTNKVLVSCGDGTRNSSFAAANGHPNCAIWNAAGVSNPAARECFEEFRSSYVQWFPFVYIPQDTTVQQLFTDRPMLWLAIMITCSRSQAEKQRLDAVFRQIVPEKMVAQAEKSIDLLLGLVGFMGWYHTHSAAPNGSIRQSVAFLSQMAGSLIMDLKIAGQPHPHQLFHEYVHVASDRSYTNETRRAFLACWLITSM